MPEAVTPKVKIFISWSGRTSQQVARALSEWLPDLMDHLEFWFSADDLRAGQRWSVALADALNACDVGVLIITPDNILSPWITFEAGALSRNAITTRVTPYLLGVEPSALSGPLAQFQASIADHAGTRKLVMDLARMRHSEAAVAAVLRRFEKFWPDFEMLLDAARRELLGRPPEENAIELLREQLDDLGQLVRQLVSVSSSPAHVPVKTPARDRQPGRARDDLSIFEGAWRVDNGSHIYARIINGCLLAPYCYTANDELTGVYSDWRRVSDYWFTKFRWVNEQKVGFGFYRIENHDRIFGSMVDGRRRYSRLYFRAAAEERRARGLDTTTGSRPSSLGRALL